MFLEKINHVTGEREWVVADEDYDMCQELARSRFGDMILDYDRNDKYLAGLKTVIAEKKSKNERVHVLDVGTGTGLLSLMAAREGADQVTALEVFTPMAECATRITQEFDWKDKITVISQRSTDLTHLGEKPNIIVAEVFDTELNGEGALRTFKEALQNLVQPGCRVVPSTGRVWAVPVKSQFLAEFNRVPRLDGLDSESCPLDACPGTSAVFDLQLSQVKPEQFEMLAEPILAFSFNFESADEIMYDEVFDRQAICTKSGDVDAVIMWWDLDMDGTGKNWIDMAPKWANSDYAICGETILFMWFTHFVGATIGVPIEPANEVSKIANGRRIVCVNEGSLIGLLAARTASFVTIVEPNIHFMRILKRYIEHYKLKNVKLIMRTNELLDKPDVIIGEPFYLSAMNPWQHLRFWHDVDAIRKDHGDDIEVWPRVNWKSVMYRRVPTEATKHAPFNSILLEEISQVVLTRIPSFSFDLGSTMWNHACADETLEQPTFGLLREPLPWLGSFWKRPQEVNLEMDAWNKKPKMESNSDVEFLWNSSERCVMVSGFQMKFNRFSDGFWRGFR